MNKIRVQIQTMTHSTGKTLVPGIFNKETTHRGADTIPVVNSNNQ